ncbi:MAG: peptidase MA family metallohydrolase [bacterium]
MIPRSALLFLVVLVAGWVFVGAPSTASAATVVESSTIANGYPKTLTFKLTARADTEITDVTLAYSIKGRGTSALDKPKDLSPAKNLSTEVVIQVNSGSNYLPVGSDFVYHWEITTADGKTTSSDEQTFFYLPPGQDWKTVSNDFMTVYYHGDREALANAYLKSGAETYDKIGKQIYGITLEQIPVKVIMFADEKESNDARPGSGSTFDAAVTTCGTKVTNDIILIIPVACGSPDRTDTLRHEFGHILNQTAGEGSLAKLPAWLDEGAAVFAQSTPGDYQSALTAAVRANRLIPFSQMTTPATDAQLVGVWYGEAWAMVNFLVQKSGPAKFSEYMSTIKGGKRFDQALSQVYGYADVNAFENDFRSSLNLQPQGQATVRPTTAPTRAATTAPATRTPTRTPAAPASGSSDGNSIGTGTIIIGGVAVLFVLGAVLAFLYSMMMANSRKERIRSAAAAQPPPPGDDDAPPVS